MNQEGDKERAEVMSRHGIREVLTAQYLYKGYRYTHLSDAVAQATRDSTRDPGRR
ncbi:hypothetical protein HRJ34_00010 [Rhizorhabdus wittichii]|uniref:Uncharacterized protein n=1 Tax=Rhizorhabdus wittichii TaxID=160791 RepID=A0A975D2Z7_9SPHN|nr:hypothetical protein [Rhizorhabdus wittichii]QTH21962.1 hypothetical protein HRJ34_00010 [Rhizorhabdus wittichii]